MGNKSKRGPKQVNWKARYEDAVKQTGPLRMQILTMRNMYEEAIQAKQGMQNILAAKDLLVGILLNLLGGSAVITDQDRDAMAGFSGFEFQDTDDGILVELIEVETDDEEE